MRTLCLTAGAFVLSLCSLAQAQSYARPPDGYRPGPAQVYDPEPYPAPPPPQADYDYELWRQRELSPFRVHVGGAGRIEADKFTPGLLAAVDFARGPAGFRLSGMWLQSGSDKGLSQYSGELTLDLGYTRPWRPVLGAGAGLTRTYRVDDEGNRIGGGSSIGVGLVRVGAEYRIPLEGTDARAGLHLMGMLPAIRGEHAPDLKPWLVAAATVGVGF